VEKSIPLQCSGVIEKERLRRRCVCVCWWRRHSYSRSAKNNAPKKKKNPLTSSPITATSFPTSCRPNKNKSRMKMV